MRITLSLLLLFSFAVASPAQETFEKPLFAPGGLIIIPPNIDYASVANRADTTELLARFAELPKPDLELQGEARFNPEVWATDIRHVRDVWCLQFSFKKVRIIDVDIPNDAGNFDKKKVWYLVYSVKNLGLAQFNEQKIEEVNSVLGSAVPAGGERLLPMPTDTTLENVPRSAPLEIRGLTGRFEPQSGSTETIRFVPQFVLATNRLVLGTEPIENPATGKTEWRADITAVAYPDRILPLALLKIQERERVAKLHTTVSITQEEIVPGEELWGVAMWTDVDPRINEFSIFVTGLTNAYQWSNRVAEDGTYVNRGAIGEGRIVKRRVLKTNWWRIGDDHSLNESQIRFGARDAVMPESIFDQTDKRTLEEREKRDKAAQDADRNADDWVSPVEKTIYHLNRQDWLKPSFGYEWVFL